VFSLAHGSIHDELNMKSRGTKKISNTVAKISEEGVLFRSYR
jgi:queuine tRNA-ribosyltransferase